MTHGYLTKTEVVDILLDLRSVVTRSQRSLTNTPIADFALDGVREEIDNAINNVREK